MNGGNIRQVEKAIFDATTGIEDSQVRRVYLSRLKRDGSL